jgi:hypothetical protein
LPNHDICQVNFGKLLEMLYIGVLRNLARDKVYGEGGGKEKWLHEKVGLLAKGFPLAFCFHSLISKVDSCITAIRSTIMWSDCQDAATCDYLILR